MNLDEARAGIGRKVIYSPFADPDFDDETGVITGVSDRHAFVAYGGQQQSKATNPDGWPPLEQFLHAGCTCSTVATDGIACWQAQGLLFALPEDGTEGMDAR